MKEGVIPNKMTRKQTPGLAMDFAGKDEIVKNPVFLTRQGRR